MIELTPDEKKLLARAQSPSLPKLKFKGKFFASIGWAFMCLGIFEYFHPLSWINGASEQASRASIEAAFTFFILGGFCSYAYAVLNLVRKFAAAGNP